MSQTAITFAFEQWKAQEAAAGNTVVLDEFVLAYVPGLDHTVPINRAEILPPAAQIVHRQTVNKIGLVNDNAVVYSVTMGTEIGDFDFNWIGLVNKASGTVAMIVHAPTQRKIANVTGQQGNVLTRSFLMEYNGAATATSITTPAETWQIDFTARLTGIDEMQRLINADNYGPGAFFGTGYLVAKTGSQFFVTQGTGYIGGIRADLPANRNIAVPAAVTKIWADVSLQGNITSQWEAVIKITVAPTLENYSQSGFMHYVFAVASIDAAGNITDLRPKGSLTDDALAQHEKSRNHPDGTLTAKGFVQLNSATDSESETLAATPKAVKQVMSYVVTAISDHVRAENPHDQYLQIENLLFEIKELGPAAVAQTLANLGLSDVASNVAVRALIDAVFPIGIPLPYPLAAIPATTLGIVFFKLNGGSFSTATYPKLAAKYPSGKLPDMRGDVIRSWDDGRGVDPGRGLLSEQGDAIRNITGSYIPAGGKSTENSDFSGAFIRQDGWQYVGWQNTNPGNVQGLRLDASAVVPTAHENRMRNIAFNYIVRAA
ncbi:phage tail protein [Yersinia sp. HM-2024]|uniref:phage tail-collar fiber domain-containing protein n=1 Tax=Yersinia sp. HM-2024 TaxID=3344550 RepID=UPI00370D9E4E